MLRQLFAAAVLALGLPMAQAEVAGTIIFVAGQAQVAERAAALNAPVSEGELLSTGKDGYIYIKTVDNGLFILRPSTQARIATYHVDRVNPANTRVKLELLSGVARSQSGEAVKQARQNFRFNTPVAAIGVRGTDFTVFTDQDTSSVAVISGRITISGFGGGCRPEGLGPCEGNSARDLSASQKGQLLQVRRGQAAPQLMQESTLAPDVVAPPRTDEPGGKQGNTSALPSVNLEPQKTTTLQLAASNSNLNGSNQGGGKSTETTMPPATIDPAPPVTPVDPTPPVTVPVVPDSKIVWGRWQPIINQAVTVDFVGELNRNSKLVVQNPDFALFRTEGKAYVIPERGSVGFTLQASEAYIHNDNPAIPTVAAKLENGVLNFNFDNRTFLTTIDLVSDSERTALKARGQVASDGRFGSENRFTNPYTTNMSVDGMLSSENGGTAAYLLNTRLGNDRTVYGATQWGKPVTK